MEGSEEVEFVAGDGAVGGRIEGTAVPACRRAGARVHRRCLFFLGEWGRTRVGVRFERQRGWMSRSGEERGGAWLLRLIPRNSLTQNNPRSSSRSSSPTFPQRPSLELSMWSSLLPFSLLALVVSVQAQGQVPAVATPAALALVDAQYVASGLNTKTYVSSSLPTRVRHLVVCPPPGFRPVRGVEC